LHSKEFQIDSSLNDKLKRNSALLSLENLAGKRLQGYRIK
jgi:hypothetical protein